jgi:putative flippase GtrA
VKESWGALGLRWVKFNAVGAVGIVVQLAALWALVHLAGVNYLVATALAVELAVLHNFVWHERFTWRDRAAVTRRESFARLVRFNLTNGGLSILGNVAIMRALVGRFRVPLLAANLATIAVCSLANFLVSHRFVFTPAIGPVRPTAPPSEASGPSEDRSARS